MRLVESSIPVPEALDEQGIERAVDAWLDVLVRLMRLPDAVRENVRCELETHLIERSRDLVIAGRPPSEAVRTAIEELGETADLARRFEDANRTRTRRTIMQISIIGAALAAVGLGAIAVNAPAVPEWQLTPVPSAQFEPEVADVDPARADWLDRRISLHFDDTPIAGAIEELALATDRQIHVHWGDLDVDPEDTVDLEIRDIPARLAFSMFLEEIDVNDWGEWSFGPDLVELGERTRFARRTTVLRSYHVDEVVMAIGERYGLEYDDTMAQIATVLTEFVDPDLWRDNGGDLAHQRIVGGTMFVQAPKPMHDRIRWILGELRRGEMLDPDGAGEAVDLFQVQ